VNAGRVRGGSTVGEERRGQGQKLLPALAGLSVRLGFGLSQTLASKAGTSLSPALFSWQPDPQPWHRVCPGTPALPQHLAPQIHQKQNKPLLLQGLCTETSDFVTSFLPYSFMEVSCHSLYCN